MDRPDDGAWAVTSSEFRILIAGRGNVCRSPFAAGMLQSKLDRLAPGEFEVDSAGVEATEGLPAEAATLESASRRGFQLRGSAARRLDEAMMSRADLILSMDRELRREVVSLVPKALRLTFTLREFARILPKVPAEVLATPAARWNSLAAIAPRYRTPPSGDASADDVVDAASRSMRIHEQMNSQVSAAVDVILSWESGSGVERRRC